MELRDVDPVRLARAVNAGLAARPWRVGLAIILILLVRAVLAARLPLSADEAYYWLWSRHLAAGYYDHPPAIAFLIRAGTFVFGDTALGVRALGVPLSALATWFVWDAARLVLNQERGKALTAALLFNLTLMIGVEMLAATPDMPSIAGSAGFLWCLARLQQTGDGRWWLAAGAAAGLGLLAKYAALFLGAGAAFWLLLDPKARKWLWTFWPWAGGVIAVLIFLPNLLWQAHHGWVTFAFQFGRVGGGHWTGRYLLEFLGAQIGLATPAVFVLGCLSGFRARPASPSFLLVALITPALAYFLIHALHDRVQGNWPCFLYPALAILAADFDFSPRRLAAKPTDPTAGALTRPRREAGLNLLARSAAPLALAILLLAYGQALTGLLPLKADPLPRLLGVGFKPVAGSLAGAERAAGAGAVLTSDYQTTAWLRFYEPDLRVVQVLESYRFPDAPLPPPMLMQGPLLYFVEQKRDRHADLAAHFRSVTLANALAIARGSQKIAQYEIYLVNGLKTQVPARMP